MNQKTLVYIESTQSHAFQFISFKTYKEAKSFVDSIESKRNTIRARIWEGF